jgi:hypothetical protein
MVGATAFFDGGRPVVGGSVWGKVLPFEGVKEE